MGLTATQRRRLSRRASDNSLEVEHRLTAAAIGDAADATFLRALKSEHGWSVTPTADRLGRRRTLMPGAERMVLAGVAFVSTGNLFMLIASAPIGVISPSGNEIGLFLSVKQAALSQVVSDERRTDVFAWYNLVGSFSTAFGALAGGLIAQASQHLGLSGAATYRLALLAYAVIGVALVVGFAFLSPAVEVTRSHDHRPPKALLGLHDSRWTIFKLSLLFALDAFGGGFVIQSIIAYWFHVRFGLDPGMLGTVFLFARLLAGVSALAAGWLARRIGLVNTMVFTHLPSNVLLILVPLMPNVQWAIGVLLLRFSISQMDVPTRQAYTMALVQPDERSAAAGVTGVARSVGASISPMLATLLMSSAGLMSAPSSSPADLRSSTTCFWIGHFQPISPQPKDNAKAMCLGSFQMRLLVSALRADRNGSNILYSSFPGKMSFDLVGVAARQKTKEKGDSEQSLELGRTVYEGR